MLAKLFLAIGAGSAGLAVMLGAFAAHGLKARLDETALSAFQTGVHYHLIHSLAICMLAIWYQSMQLRFQLSDAPGINLLLFLFGIVFFSGSLYLLSLGGPRWLGPITPIGGTFFIAAWAMFAYRALNV